MKPSGTTTIDYKLRTLVVLGDTSPELAIAIARKLAQVQRIYDCSMDSGDCYEDAVNTITSFDIESDSRCTNSSSSNLDLIASNAGGLTSINDLSLTWSEENESGTTYYYLESVEFASGSNGVGCNPNEISLRIAQITVFVRAISLSQDIVKVTLMFCQMELLWKVNNQLCTPLTPRLAT